MNQKEWKQSKSFKSKYKWYNQARKLQKSLQYNENPEATVIHHLRDTEEQRNYNDTYYEFWGFNLDGTFEYGKYIVFLTKEEHSKYHSASVETRAKIGEASKRNWEDPAYRQRVIDANTGKTMSDEARQKCRETKLGDKNPMYGKHPSEETNSKRRDSLNDYWSSDRSSVERDRRKIASSGKNNAMYGRFGESHPKYGCHLSDETKNKISESRKELLKHKCQSRDDSILYKQYKSKGGTLTWNAFRTALKDGSLDMNKE